MLTFRGIRKGDIERIVELEALCFEDPWPAEAFEIPDYQFSYVALEDDLIIGYIINIVALDEASIASIGIHPDFQRRGYASRLLRHTLRMFKEVGISKVFLDVRPSNRAARNLYLKHGFRYLGVRKGYYQSPPEDALVMAKIEGNNEIL
ncbi:MAG: ribosomal protein S18-alanine N-acetyltransferase [Candidatus Cloacimonetes bacterium]|nr:ribosomal protein S18-alanine N-acetyltransferase [Candidatus Cloacimonadota bacterium]